MPSPHSELRRKTPKYQYRDWIGTEGDPRQWERTAVKRNFGVLVGGGGEASPNECVWRLRFLDQEPASDSSEFSRLVKKWQRETKHSSSVKRSILHPAYLRIIGMGRPILPLLLKELRNNPDHWFVALTAIAGTDPAEHTQTFDEAVAAWLEWGRQNALITD